jgi:hypothetical protein
MIGSGTGSLAAPGQTTVVIKLTHKARNALKRARKVKLTLHAVATDGAGNVSAPVDLPIRLKP